MNPDLLVEFSPEWFDACSKAWTANKKRKGYSYVYVCEKPMCKNVVHQLGNPFCKWHTVLEEEEKENSPRRSPRLSQKGKAPSS
jgi:hypothetical protein